ncbi:MAG: amidase family protein, partial [Bacillota bacterium]
MSKSCLDALRTVEAVTTGEMSPREAIDLSLSSISRLNPRVGAFLVAEEPAEGEFEGPLGGLPYAAKDNLCTRDLPTTCASHILEGYSPPYDAHVISRMRGAGAALVGKTNMDEFAMGSSNENSHFGPVRNPWDLSRVPGGSSGGSAAAVAAGMVPVALGSDTGGSIRQPSAFCGITGMKPTYGAVSRRGLVAFASSMDQVGPMARSARDCALVLDALVSWDAEDSTSIKHPDAGSFLRQVRSGKDGLHGIRIGLPREYYAEGIDPDIADVARKTARTLEGMGAKVEEMSLPHTEYALPTYYVMASAEASSNLSRYDGIRYGLRETGDGIEELYRNTRTSGFGDEVKRRIMLGSYALSAGYYDAFYLKAARVRRAMTE